MQEQNFTVNPELKSFIDNTINTERDDSTVTVFPLRCGLGKSIYLSNLISEIVHSDSPDGVIIVTDSIERLYSYTSNAVDKRNITTMTADNVAESMKKQYFSKVLLMTTQRYFNLTREEIITLLTYKDGKRVNILIDERPILKKDHQITIKDFNDVDSALQMSIDDTANTTEKAWCVNQWERLKDHIQSVMDSYESLTEKSHFHLYHTDDWQTLTADDNRFFKFIEANKSKIATQKYTDAYSKIKLIQRILTEGAVFSCQKKRSGQYFKCFTLMIDHREKLTNLGAKVFVLDASADIEPSYSSEYINIVDCDSLNNIPLDRLTINCVNVSTSKNKLESDEAHRADVISAVKNYIVEKCENAAVFTYKSIEGEFSEYTTAHFGDIKGTNQFINCTDIVQVGLNRFPEIAYFMMTDEFKFDVLMLKNLPPEDCITAFERRFDFRTKNSWFIEDTMFQSVFADIEQNLFRGNIRNIFSTDKMTYTIFFDTTIYAYLIDLMRERYGSRGALINVIDTPTEIKISKAKNRQTKQPTVSQVFYQWYDQQPKGRVFTPLELMKECEFSKEQFKNLKRANKEMMQKLRTDKEGIYIIA